MSDALNISIPEKPVRKDSLVGEEMEQDNEVVYVDAENDSIFSLNNTASAILDLCDGSRTSRDIAVVVADTLDVDVERAFKDTESVLEEFVVLGLVA